MDIWNAIGLLVLGWLFGLLSPVITRKIEQERHAVVVQNGISAELKELVSRLALVTSLITGKFGDYTRDHVHWVVSALEHSRKGPDDAEMLEIMRAQAKLKDADFDILAQHQKAEANAGLGLKKYEAPYLSAKVGELSMFPEDSQRALIGLIANLRIFNEEVDDARHYFNLTYDESLSPKNHAQVSASLIQSYLNVGNRARIVVDAAIEYLANHTSSK